MKITCDNDTNKALIKGNDDKDIYSDYQDYTLGLSDIYNYEFRQPTNPTKSKYDNVIGWVKL